MPASDIGDLLENFANVDLGGGPRTSAQRFFIRGLSDERILFLLDGARHNYDRGHDSRIFLDHDLLKQIEILRGPSSALWGSGAIGGVVALTTKDAMDMLTPGKRIGARIKGGYQGVNNQRLVNGSVYGLAGDNIDYLFNIAYRKSGDIDLGDGTTLDHSGAKSVAGLAKVTWTPHPFHTIVGSVQTYDVDEEIPNNGQALLTGANPLVDQDSEQRNYTLKYDYENPDNAYLRPSLLVYRNSTELVEDRKPVARHDETEFTTTGFDVRNSMSFGKASCP